MTQIEALRAFYARYITAQAGCHNPSVQHAFAAIAREHYLGPGPWTVPTASGYVSTGTADPAVLYQDILIGLNTERKINNGEPSLHARAWKRPRSCRAALSRKSVQAPAITPHCWPFSPARQAK